jgi:hypothetical protein
VPLWLVWLVVWVLLLAFAALVLYRCGRMLWRKTAALFTELGEAGDRLALAGELRDAVAAAKPEPELAVFADPTQLRRSAGRGNGAGRGSRRGSGRATRRG